MKLNRDYNLDLIKVIACFSVVGLHTLKSDVSIFNSIVYYLCGFAVPVFFMSSGYILVNRPSVAWKRTRSKCVRIFLIAMAWGLMLELARLSYHLLIKKQMDLPQNYLIRAFGGLIQKGTMFHLWYLGALIIIYLIVYVLFKTNLIKKKQYLWMSMLGVCLLLQLLDYLMGVCLQKYVIQTFRLWTFVQYFLLGGLMPAWIPKIRKLHVGLHAGCLIIISCCIPAFQLIMKDRIGDPHAEFFYDDILTILWVVVLFSFVMRLPLSNKTERVVSFFSPLIMGIYILHVLVIKVFKHFIPLDSFVKFLIAWVGVFAISLIGTVVLSKIPVVKKLISI